MEKVDHSDEDDSKSFDLENEHSEESPGQRILILKADQFYADALKRAIFRTFPKANVTITNRAADARERLSSSFFDLFLTGICLPDGDAFDAMATCTRERPRRTRVFVVTGRREEQILTALCLANVDGVFDTVEERPENFDNMLRQVGAGVRVWSQSLLDLVTQRLKLNRTGFDFLSRTERLVLAVIGDGCDDVAAAEHLGRSPATIQTVRRQLHRKLAVQHKGDLVRVAAEHGFVCINRGVTIRPGLSLMLEARAARQRSPLRDAAGRG